MSRRDLICLMCYYQAPNRRRLICHCLVKHKNDAQFIAFCTVPGCMYSTRSYNAFKIHNRRKHRQLDSGADVNTHDTWQREYDETEAELIVDVDINEDVELGCEETHSRSYIMMLAKFYLSLETEHKCTRTSIDSIALSNKDIMSTVLDIGANKVKDILQRLGQNPQEVSDFVREFTNHVQGEVISTADKFITNYSRQQIYAKLCHLVKPRSCHMGFENIRVMGRQRRKFLYGYYIPMREMLEALMNLPEIWQFFTNPHQSQDEIQRDVNDGLYIKNHPLNQETQKYLKISLSFDDVEIQNPLRSSHKYKLSMFYFQILNIPVEYRSRLTSIFLYGVCKAKYIQKFGMKQILRNFTETMNDMRTNGIQMTINNAVHNIKGTLVFAICDTPAAASLAGFKEGCAFARKPCRRCLATQKTMREKFRPSDFRNRTMASYLYQCQVLERQDLSKGQKAYWSKCYGVNGRSPLCEISGFDVTSQMLMDNMHLIAEGCGGYLLGLFLHYCIIENRYFTLEWLNTKIQNYAYPYWDKGHKPELITRHQLVSDVYVKQKAVAMISLLFSLPHILGPIFPLHNDHYRHFIYLVQITQLAFSPYTTAETCPEIEDLIQNVGSKWTQLYPLSRVRPKLHFLVHLVAQIKDFGSLHGISCLRFEAKHGWFKDARIRQYRNLSFSLASKHQLYMCNKMIDINGGPSKNFIYGGDEIGDGNVITVSRISADIHRILCSAFGDQERFEVYETNRINMNGIEYKNGAVILIDTDELGHPTFGVIEHIFVSDEVKYFAFTRLEANCYIWQFHSYDVSMTESLEIIKWENLSNKFPLAVIKIEGKSLVMNRFSQHCGNI